MSASAALRALRNGPSRLQANGKTPIRQLNSPDFQPVPAILGARASPSRRSGMVTAITRAGGPLTGAHPASTVTEQEFDERRGVTGVAVCDPGARPRPCPCWVRPGAGELPREGTAMNAQGCVYSWCGCRDQSSGRRMGARCPLRGAEGHGSWYLSLELPPALDGSRRRIRRGGAVPRADPAGGPDDRARAGHVHRDQPPARGDGAAGH